MAIKRNSLFAVVLLFCVLLLASCASQTSSRANLSITQITGKSRATPTGTKISTPGKTGTARPTSPSTPAFTPTHYRSRLLLSGRYRPDDLAFDPAGHLVFSDVFHGTVNRLNANGTVTVLVRGLAGPEGLVFLPNGTLIIAEQQTNRILAFSPATSALTVLRVLPGRPSGLPCKDGVDGIALDPTTQSLIVPDSPIGAVYRMSLDGSRMTLLATRIPRPVGAAVDRHGNIYIADECGGALWKITPADHVTRLGGFGMLDDVAFDPRGNLLVTDLKPSIHALLRINPVTGARETLASRGLIEPQGLVVDARGNIYLSDDYADKIVEYFPL